MLSSKSLRQAGVGVVSCQRRVVSQHVFSRQFSINTIPTNTSRLTRPLLLSRRNAVQQTRSLSLFGWGGSSKPPADTNSTSATDNVTIGPNTAGLGDVRTIKATHATSDMPDPSQSHLHPPNNFEPQILEDLQERITRPHGSAADKIKEIINDETDITAIPERMGYLKDVCGLDFGWGPSSVMETVLEFIHIHGGLSWTMSILTLAVALRLAMLKPIIDGQKQANKMREISPFLTPLRERYTALLKQGNQQKAIEVAAEMKELNKSSGISYSKAFIPLLIQIPFSYGAFRVLRNAGHLPVPAFVTEDWLWTTDLSFSDPYFITPAISALFIHLSIKQATSGGSNPMLGPQGLKIISTLMPAMSFVFMLFQPGSVQLYFLTTGALAYGTSSALRQQWARDMLGLGPMPPPPGSTTTPVPTGGAVAQPVQSKLPAGIQRIASTPPPIADVPVAKQPAQNRSLIDKVIDRAKDKTKSLTSAGGGTGGWIKSPEEKEQERRQAASKRYEAQRGIQLDRERRERNEQSRGE